MNVCGRIYRWFEYPHRFHAVRHILCRPGIKILDVGCGNHSPSLTKRFYPQCHYTGLDRDRWNRDEDDDALMDEFYTIDLEKPHELIRIPNDNYDIIFCSHVLEHVTQPQAVLERLIPKLRAGGAIYIEVPSSRSLRLPKARNGWMGIRGCLNFFDDPTHKAPVPMTDIVKTLSAAGLEVHQVGRRFLWRRVILLPFYAIAGLILRGYIPASVVWDILGFADVVMAMRPAVHRLESATIRQKSCQSLPFGNKPGSLSIIELR
ncbi:MAG: class I SAM-dependent methyltransferase [Thermogutta sp.]